MARSLRFRVIDALAGIFAALSADGIFRRRLRTFFESETKVQRLFQEILREPGLVRKKNPDAGLFAQYSIAYRFGLSAVADESIPGIHWDAHNGLILMCDSRAVAVVGFRVIKDRVSVLQIQGVAGSENELNKLLWRQVIIRFLIEIARLGGYRTVRIIPGHETDYFGQINYASDTDPVTIEQESRRGERLIEYFDGSAKKMGFESDGRFWNYSLRA